MESLAKRESEKIREREKERERVGWRRVGWRESRLMVRRRKKQDWMNAKEWKKNLQQNEG